ncbi:unnamed protein product [Calicophoron daubneyi]|uniref:SCP domain-containing protein n=1 Tax=Calicophoron daubneyi TaxID=300641 RepID=A0AAV2TCL1_CALDB
MAIEIDEEFNQECLEEHNRLRALHGCPPLTLDEELAISSQAYAEKLIKDAKVEHSTGDWYGENLARRTSSAATQLSGKEAADNWYREVENYRYSGGHERGCGHFTQVVWKSTTSAGFGRAISKDRKQIYVVGRYKPPGNILKHIRENVPKPIEAENNAS